jgi:cobalt-zinc-cadmium resistance protein CzcA
MFNSLRDSLLALSGIPFTVGGGILGLWIAGLDLSVSSLIGFVSLFGVSVMDGILMNTYYNQDRRGGMSVFDAMYNASEQRMRPRLMTALSACIGLFPAALSNGIGSQVQKPLATVVVGGMLIGPIMLLLVVPALRMLFLREDPVETRPAAEESVTP